MYITRILHYKLTNPWENEKWEKKSFNFQFAYLRKLTFDSWFWNHHSKWSKRIKVIHISNELKTTRDIKSENQITLNYGRILNFALIATYNGINATDRHKLMEEENLISGHKRASRYKIKAQEYEHERQKKITVQHLKDVSM